MRLGPSDAPRSRDRRARAAVGVLFFANAAVFANLAPRYPEIKAALDLGEAAYGLAIAAYPAGAVAAGLAAGPLVRRFGSARVAVAGMALTGLGVLAAGVAPTVTLLAVGLAVAGATDAVTDVAQNAHGLRVQAHYGRSILNSFHALWSLGAVAGGVMAAGAIAAGVPLGLHLAVSAAVFAVVSLVVLRHLLPGPDDEREGSGQAEAGPHQTGSGASRSPRRPLGRPHRVPLVLVALVLIVLADTVIEDAGTSWATLYLATALHAAPEVAPAGFIALVGAQVIGRFLGDRLVDRFGQRSVARAGGLLVALGMGQALAVPGLVGTIVGLALAGFGTATLVPSAMHQADRLPGLRAGTGLAVVSWFMRVGFLLSPPIVGALAEAGSLRAGLVLVPVAGAVVMVLAQVLPGRAGAAPSTDVSAR